MVLKLESCAEFEGTAEVLFMEGNGFGKHGLSQLLAARKELKTRICNVSRERKGFKRKATSMYVK